MLQLKKEKTLKLIIVDDLGIQKLCSLPSGTEIKLETNESNLQEKNSKNERIARMLAAQGRHNEIKTDEFKNYIEAGYWYVTSSGSEYLKMDLDEFWKFLEVCNALSMIDAGEQAFYAVNVYYPKIKHSNNSDGIIQTTTTDLDSFLIPDPEGTFPYNSTMGDLCTCLARDILKEQTDLLKYV